MSEIFFSPTTAVFNNSAPGTCIAGSPGKGKSFCMVNLAGNALEASQRIICLDAKNDMLPLKNINPNIEIIDVNNIKPGVLDPFYVLDEIDTTIILTICDIIVGGMSETQRLAVAPIIKDFLNMSKSDSAVTFKKFADYLFANPKEEAQVIGNALLLNDSTKYGKLIFGDGNIKHRGKKLNIGNKNAVISILGMELPRNENPKADECLNAAVVYILCSLIKTTLEVNSATKNTKIPTILFFDECHVLMQSQQITELIDKILVLGRSLNVAVVLATQNVTHFPESITNLISTKICFGVSKAEASEFLYRFDTTTGNLNEINTSEVSGLISQLKTGYAFVIDEKGSAAFVHIRSVYDLSDINSNPLAKAQVKNKLKVSP